VFCARSSPHLPSSGSASVQSAPFKPSHGICCFTTTIFGTHHGADQGAGRSTSGQDLLRLLGGSTSALPPSTAGLLHLPRLTSTLPGRHTVVSDLHQHFWAGIFILGPAYLCLGRHIYVPSDICGARVDSGIPPANICVFWPEYTPTGWHIAVLAFFGRNKSVPGRFWPFLAGSGRLGPRLGRHSDAAAHFGLIHTSRLLGPS
jgi:hypothetical protein